MQSNHDHGERSKSRIDNAGAAAQAFQPRGSLTTKSNPSPPHPVLIELARLLAREAAAAWIVGENATLTFAENANDQD